MLRLRRQQQRLDAERREDVAVGRIARRRQRDAIAGIEGGEEGDEEAGRGAGGHHDAARIEVVAVPLAIVAGDAPAPRPPAHGIGVADEVAVERRERRRPDAVKTGQASSREKVLQYGYISGAGGSFKKKQKNTTD